MKVKLYEGQKHTLYELQKKLGLSNYTLYQYATGKYNVKNMKIKMILDIAYLEKIEPNNLLKLMIDYQTNKNSPNLDKSTKDR